MSKDQFFIYGHICNGIKALKVVDFFKCPGALKFGILVNKVRDWVATVGLCREESDLVACQLYLEQISAVLPALSIFFVKNNHR